MPGRKAGPPRAEAISSRTTSQPARQSPPSSSRWCRKYGRSIFGSTSFSSPIISGVIAQMVASNSSLSSETIRQILKDTANKVGGYDYNWNPAMPGHSFELGYGRVNAESAVLAAGGNTIFEDGFESGDTTAWSSSVP